jgi:arylsulfatase A-like enzyme
VRTRRWKYIRNAYEPPFEELYDLAADPHELDNLLVTAPQAAEPRAALAVLRARLAELRPD